VVTTAETIYASPAKNPGPLTKYKIIIIIIYNLPLPSPIDIDGMREDSQNLPLLDALMRHYDELVDHVRRRFGDKNFAHEVVHEVYMHVVNARPRE
jgi:hypothetical protein